MKQKPGTTLLRLWGESWELWELPQTSSLEPSYLGPAPERPSTGKDCILSVPARWVVAAPIWVDSQDPEIIQNSIELEMEVRGLLPKRKFTDVVCFRKLVEGNKSLVICAIFPPEVPARYSDQPFTRYEASPLLVDPVEDGLTLWREGEDIVAVFTRNREVVYWSTTDWPAESKQLSLWLKNLILHLLATRVLSKWPSRVAIDSNLKAYGFKNLIPLISEEAIHLKPSLKSADFKWKPEDARETERKRVSTRKTRRIILSVAAAYLLVVSLAGLDLSWLHFKSQQLQTRIGQLEMQTGKFQPSIREWRIVGPGAETAYYPIEILHRVVKNMPASGIRLTIYDTTDGRVSIEGEAESVSQASQFLASLSQDKDLQQMNWEMPTPALLPNNAARFQLTGVAP